MWKQGDILELMDPSLASSCRKSELFRYIHIGLLCVQERATDRPTMSDIISMLTNEAVFLPDPKQLEKTEAGLTLPDGKMDINSVNCVSVTIMEAR